MTRVLLMARQMMGMAVLKTAPTRRQQLIHDAGRERLET